MKEQLEDILVGLAALTKKNADGTIERCSMDELIGKDLEVVSSSSFSFNEIKNKFEQSDLLLTPNNARTDPHQLRIDPAIQRETTQGDADMEREPDDLGGNG